ncbi:DUF4386 domain-containing protein [Halobacillus sp. Nhm2S1]|uniref:DUF4386 domain-containing protein n=1 Tax=Halobacillus sp. Nhm2S1 TaxID=2866716 RepID=UPI001C7336EC|nr:DUF4386 domain-containing protein [Halobacillus sp. Nhm2S1]
MKKLNKNEDFQRQPAIIAGVSLIFMTLAAFFSYGYVHSSLVIQEDANRTYDLLQSSLSLLHLGIGGWLVIIFTDLIVTWAFYKVLKPVHPFLCLIGRSSPPPLYHHSCHSCFPLMEGQPSHSKRFRGSRTGDGQHSSF